MNRQPGQKLCGIWLNSPERKGSAVGVKLWNNIGEGCTAPHGDLPQWSVYDKAGQPLMPAGRHGKVIRMLRDGRAKVVHNPPLYDTANCMQPLTLLGDAGSKAHRSVRSDTERELYASEVELRTGVAGN